MKIVTAAQMRGIDKESARLGMPTSLLMENAGRAVAEETRDYFQNIKKQHIVCLIGAGNNGGDGLVAARYLREWGAKVTVYLCSPRPANDPNLILTRDSGMTIIETAQDVSLARLNTLLGSATGIIDALLGTGKMRPLEGTFKAVLEKVNAAKSSRKFSIIAVDLPSGMDADTGAADPACPAADLTVTLAFPKPGLYSFPGAEKAGKIRIADIGIAASLANHVNMELLTGEWAGAALPRRRMNSNKGSFGRALIIAGSTNYQGAAYLACAGALRSGAGLVTLGSTGAVRQSVAARLAEATYLPLPETAGGAIAAGAAEIIAKEITKYNVMLAGCGLGQDAATAEFVRALTDVKDLPVIVLDADALNIIANVKDRAGQLPGKTVLTPHPGEMARLCGLTIEEIQKDRTGTASRYAAAWGKTIVLKGAFTVVAAADGRVRVSPFANPGLATAGTGDVLAGVIAGLAAQGIEPYDAASLGVYLHGAAGERVREAFGDAGMIASDLLPALPVIIKQLKNSG